jgi:CopG family nickel-responsive transcriptional regulator
LSNLYNAHQAAGWVGHLCIDLQKAWRPGVERISISLDEALAEEFDRFLAQHGYSNRSEAVRDLIRQKVEAQRLEKPADGYGIGTLTYVYNHRERELASRLTRAQHHHHDLILSAHHVHLDHDNCMETVVLRGLMARVREFADSVIARPGVRHGQLYLVPVELDKASHRHGDAHGAVDHTHARPQT